MADKLTISEFAQKIKERDPRLAGVPDDELVRKVLERRPDMLGFLETSEPRKPLNSLYKRVGGRIKSNLDPIAMGDYIGKLGEAINHPPYPKGGGLKAIGETLSSTYSKPENVLGDLISAYIFNSAEGGPEPVKSGIKGATASTLQRLSGAGREPVLLEQLARNEAIQKATESYFTKLAKVQEQEKMVAVQSKYGDDLLKNLQETYDKVSKKLDSRWSELRSTPTNSGGKLGILNDSTGNAKDIVDGIDTAERKFLHGAPGSVRQFRDIVGWIDRSGIKGVMVKPTWDELRTHYSSMGDAMYGRPIPNNVYRALKYVREEVVGKQLHELATQAGAGDKYQDLLKDYSQFENDWKNTHSVTRAGGSPLAVARKAPNSATLIPQVTGKTGDLLVKQLAKYQDHGASPMTASAIRKVGSVNVPKQPTIPKDPEPINPVEVRRKRILEYTSRPKSMNDYLPPRLFTEPLLSNKSIREWVAKYPRKEFPVPKADSK